MKVQFLQDTSNPRMDSSPPGTLVLFREGFGYSLPNVSGAEYMEFSDFKPRYSTLTPLAMIVVGLNRMLTQSNRCEMLWEYLFTMTPSIPKVSIDTAPFLGEPWRLWFHYGLTGAGKFGVTYSYAIETEWQHWFYRDTADCRLSGANIGLFLTDTISDLPPLTTSFDLTEIGPDDEEWYGELRQSVFAKRDTPKLIIRDLLSAVNRRYDTSLSFDSYLRGGAVTVPDLGVCRFVIEENERRMATYNGVVLYENVSDPERA